LLVRLPKADAQLPLIAPYRDLPLPLLLARRSALYNTTDHNTAYSRWNSALTKC
jgi:hypothetical protein